MNPLAAVPGRKVSGPGEVSPCVLIGCDHGGGSGLGFPGHVHPTRPFLVSAALLGRQDTRPSGRKDVLSAVQVRRHAPCSRLTPWVLLDLTGLR